MAVPDRFVPQKANAEKPFPRNKSAAQRPTRASSETTLGICHRRRGFVTLIRGRRIASKVLTGTSSKACTIIPSTSAWRRAAVAYAARLSSRIRFQPWLRAYSAAPLAISRPRRVWVQVTVATVGIERGESDFRISLRLRCRRRLASRFCESCRLERPNAMVGELACGLARMNPHIIVSGREED